MSRSATRASLWMLAASVALAAMAATTKLASQHGAPIGQILFYRGVISLVLVYTWLRKSHLPLATSHLTAHLRRGVVGFAGMVAYVVAVALLPLSTAVTLIYTSPLMLASMLLLIDRERLQPFMIVSMLGGLGGVVLLLQPSYDSSQWLGAAVALLHALLASVTALNIRALGRLGEPSARTVVYFSLCVSVGALPLFVFSHPESLTGKGALYVILAGVSATIGQVLVTHAYQHGHTILVSLLSYSQIVFTTMFEVVIWGQRPAMGAWLGMILVIVSGAVATLSMRAVAGPTRTENCASSNLTD